MKKTGRFFSIIISVMTFMTFCLSNFSASAADNDYKITVKNTNTAVSISGKTFYAYKIFSLTYENECYTYSTDSTCIDRQYSGYDPKLRNCTEVIESIKDESNARKFGDWVYNTYIKDGYVGDAFCSQATVPLARETVDIELEDAGYWLVFGTGDNKYGYEGSNTVTSLVMLGVASPTITVNPKFDAPSLDKEIYHNDNEENPWGVVGDNQIGDTVKFRLLSYIPDINGYSSYTYTIHDTLSAGLTYDTGSLSVKIDDDSSDILSDTYYTVAVEGQKIDITFDIKTAIANKVIKPKQKLYTYYTATLNENAKVAGSAVDKTNYNENTAYLEYPNNPYDSESTGKTPESKVYDWTYKITINKINENDQPLSGAGFTIKAGNTVLKFTQQSGTTDYVVDPNGDVTEIKTDPTGSFTILGLDDDTTYELEETTVPNGYEKCANVKIKFDSSYNYIGNELSSLTATVDNAFSYSSDDGVFIKNLLCTKLAETGGIGTKIFYVFGGALVIVAGVLLVTKRRMKNHAE